MIDCKAMTAPMTTNLKLLNDDTFETVDATLYRQNELFTNLLNQYKTKYMFCCKHTKLVHGESQTNSPDRSKTCDEVSKGNFRLWAQIYIRW